MIINFVLGSLYLWGNVSPYVISYFYHKGDTYLKNNDGIIILSLYFFAECLFNPVGAYLVTKFNIKIVLTISAIFICLSTYAAKSSDSWPYFVFF